MKKIAYLAIILTCLFVVCYFSLFLPKTHNAGKPGVDRYDDVLLELREIVKTEKDNKVPDFLLHYAIVSHKLKNDTGYPMELIELYKKDRASATFLCEFWREKAMEKCSEHTKQTIEVTVRQMTQAKTEEEEKEAEKKGMDRFKQSLYSFYYDNWDAVNETIYNKLVAAKITVKIKY